MGIGNLATGLLALDLRTEVMCPPLTFRWYLIGVRSAFTNGFSFIF